MARNEWDPKGSLSPQLLKGLISTGEDLWNRAEPGFKEHQTHRYLLKQFEKMGFEIELFDGIPGFSAAIPGAKPKIAVVADMDGLPNPGTPDGAYIHSCGHHMQTTALLGAAMILQKENPEALKALAFMPIPAEEYIDFDVREALVEGGVVSRMSGKQELLARGLFDCYERVVSTHAGAFKEPIFVSSVLAMGGFEVLRFHFEGVAAHAGAAPHKGINAQNAAALFLQACAFLRESFAEDDHVRIHPVVSMSPGQSVNIIPARVSAETYVRAASPQAIETTVAKLFAAAEGSARSIGCRVDIEKIPGYAPFKADGTMHRILQNTVEDMGIPFIEELYSTPSSDMGDVSQFRPSIMLGLPGVNGLFHNPAFKVVDKTMAYAVPALVLSRYLPRILEAENLS